MEPRMRQTPMYLECEWSETSVRFSVTRPHACRRFTSSGRSPVRGRGFKSG